MISLAYIHIPEEPPRLQGREQESFVKNEQRRGPRGDEGAERQGREARFEEGFETGVEEEAGLICCCCCWFCVCWVSKSVYMVVFLPLCNLYNAQTHNKRAQKTQYKHTTCLGHGVKGDGLP
jgi:hypothetical protein